MNAFTQMGLALQHLAKDMPDKLEKELTDFGDAMVEYLQQHWPRDTGVSAEGWLSLSIGNGVVRVMNPYTYTSYVHAKGDKEKVPVYIAMLRDAAAYAAEKVPIEARITDLTKEYVGKGWKHRPTNVIWLAMKWGVTTDDIPHTIEATVNVPGAQAGTFTVTPGR